MDVDAFLCLAVIAAAAVLIIYVEIVDYRHLRAYRGLHISRLYYCRRCGDVFVEHHFEKLAAHCPRCGHIRTTLRF